MPILEHENSRIEIRFPDWDKDEQPEGLFEKAVFYSVQAILLAVDRRQDAEIRIDGVVCGLYGIGEGSTNTTVTAVTPAHVIVEVRNN